MSTFLLPFNRIVRSYRYIAINISLDLEQRPMPKFMTLPNRASINGTPMTSRALEIERARERRRRSQREMLI